MHLTDTILIFVHNDHSWMWKWEKKNIYIYMYVYIKRERDRSRVEMYRMAPIPFPWLIEGQSGKNPLLLTKIIGKRDKLLGDSDWLY